jgi:hypothetical protein
MFIQYLISFVFSVLLNIFPLFYLAIDIFFKYWTNIRNSSGNPPKQVKKHVGRAFFRGLYIILLTINGSIIEIV